jgi:hypothetical protein
VRSPTTIVRVGVGHERTRLTPDFVGVSIA